MDIIYPATIAFHVDILAKLVKVGLNVCRVLMGIIYLIRNAYHVIPLAKLVKLQPLIV